MAYITSYCLKYKCSFIMPMRTLLMKFASTKNTRMLISICIYSSSQWQASRQIPTYNKAASPTLVVINQVFFPQKAVRCTVQMPTFRRTDHINKTFNLLLSMLKRNLFKSEIWRVSKRTRTWASWKLLSWAGAPTGYNWHDNSQLAETSNYTGLQHLPVK